MSPNIQISPIKEVHTKTTVLGCRPHGTETRAVHTTRKSCLLFPNSCYSNKNITSDFQVLSCQGANFILIYFKYLSPFWLSTVVYQKEFEEILSIYLCVYETSKCEYLIVYLNADQKF